jgi:hypothetical protein
MASPQAFAGFFRLAALPDPATIQPRTDAERIRHGIPGYGLLGTTVRCAADIPFVGALVKMNPGDSVAVPPRRLTAARQWARTACETLDRSYTIAPVADGYRCWRTR